MSWCQIITVTTDWNFETALRWTFTKHDDVLLHDINDIWIRWYDWYVIMFDCNSMSSYWSIDHIFHWCIWGGEFLRRHVDFGEVFCEWKLFETSRATYNFFHKKWQLFHGPGGLVAVMAHCCDYLHPRLNRSTALQCIHHVTNSISCTLYDGVSIEDMQVLLMEATKLCVTHLYLCVCRWFTLYVFLDLNIWQSLNMGFKRLDNLWHMWLFVCLFHSLFFSIQLFLTECDLHWYHWNFVVVSTRHNCHTDPTVWN